MIGRLKKVSLHKTRGDKNFGKSSNDLFILEFFGVAFLVFGEIYERF